MLIHPVSDLHLEFLNPLRHHFEQALSSGNDMHFSGEWGPKRRDVVVVAGDAHLDVRAPGWLRRLYGDCEIVYTPGNHEYYTADLETLDDDLRRECQRYGIHFLQCDSVEINSVVFAGCTLWTDFKAFEPKFSQAAAGIRVQDSLADYRFIKIQGRPLTWQDTLALHEHHLAWLSKEIAQHEGRDLVIVTHHMPVLMTAAHYLDDVVTAGFCSRLDDLVELSRARYWICGHTHHPCQKQLGETLVVNNSCGYPDEDSCFLGSLVLEV
jgi:hypothetical protein